MIETITTGQFICLNMHIITNKVNFASQHLKIFTALAKGIEFNTAIVF